jgi:hypothetical protein
MVEKLKKIFEKREKKHLFHLSTIRSTIEEKT